MAVLLLLGPAGSGKTTLARSLGEYLEDEGYSVAYVNLDSAVEVLPYRPDFDIRSMFTLEQIMKEYGLGPNGALVKSVELMLERLEDLRRHVHKLELSNDFVLVDTPGQLEPVIFHSSGPQLLRELARSQIVVFLLPSDLLRSPRDAVFLNLITLGVKYRLGIPMVRVFSKSDVLTAGFNVEDLMEPNLSNFLELGLEGEFAYKMLQIIREYGVLRQRPIFISSVTKEGLDDLLTAVHEVLCTCGDLR